MEHPIPVLYYHYIKKPAKSVRIKGLYVSPRQFEWQIKKLIRKGYHFITFNDLALNKVDLQAKNIILTFDDGCESVYQNAFPVLKKYSIPAVVYVVADCMDQKQVVWTQNENNDPVNTLNAAQLLEMQAEGIEIASHALSHRHLTGLSKDEQLFELTESKKILEKLLNTPVVSVAYPFGSYNDDVTEAAQKAGYKYAVTTLHENNSDAKAFTFHRFSVKGVSIRHYFYFFKTLKKIAL